MLACIINITKILAPDGDGSWGFVI